MSDCFTNDLSNKTALQRQKKKKSGNYCITTLNFKFFTGILKLDFL